MGGQGVHRAMRNLKHAFSLLLEGFVQLLSRQTVLVLILLVSAGIGAVLWNMSQLSTNVVRFQAKNNAALYAQALKTARTFYSSEVVDRVNALPDVDVTHDYLSQPHAIPLPATFLLELSERLNTENTAVSVRLYSDYPFPWRREQGGPKDPFEQMALTYLRQHPDQSFSRFEQFQGQETLRYAQADIMKPTCVACHNTHPDTPKSDWQVGDVRGVLAVNIPLGAYTQEAHVWFKGAFVSLGGLASLATCGIVVVIARLRKTSEELELRVLERTAELRRTNQALAQEQEKSERLLLNILPPLIAEALKEGESNIADSFPEVTILFADIVNFTQLAERLPPALVVTMLNEIFSAFDSLTERYDLEKIKTIGDAYMVAGGIPLARPDHAIACAEMALAMREEITRIGHQFDELLDLRIGLNTGPVVAGVIGTKKFIYDLWGDTVNTASRMESHGAPGKIQVTEMTYQLLRDHYTLTAREPIYIKGKGLMQTYFLTGRRWAASTLPSVS